MIPARKTTVALRNQLLSKGQNPKSTVGVINLGCARNLVDSQIILGGLKKKGYSIVEAEGADVAIVNTCSFIEEAKAESIDVILDLLELKKKGKIKKVIVAGCLAQRYANELLPELKGVDAYVGALALERAKFHPQVSLTPKHFAYVKICESCFNQCSFCAIPKIKGKFSSRTIESVVEEVIALDKKGVKEINIIGQDITAYGMDIYRKKSLARLLREIASKTANVKWIRLLYAFPAHMDDELIATIASERKICRYIDMPVQHISDKLLTAMNRSITKEQTIDLIAKIRKQIPESKLRTTFIVGFPGETDKEFKELLEFVKETRFERAGVFVYSKEEGTPAHDFEGHVPEPAKKRRLDILMKEQRDISKALQQNFIGKTLPVLIEQKQKDAGGVYLGRTEYDAPDVDGLVYVYSQKELTVGSFVDVTITDALEYDLSGEAL